MNPNTIHRKLSSPIEKLNNGYKLKQTIDSNIKQSILSFRKEIILIFCYLHRDSSSSKSTSSPVPSLSISKIDRSSYVYMSPRRAGCSYSLNLQRNMFYLYSFSFLQGHQLLIVKLHKRTLFFFVTVFSYFPYILYWTLFVFHFWYLNRKRLYIRNVLLSIISSLQIESTCFVILLLDERACFLRISSLNTHVHIHHTDILSYILFRHVFA